MRKLIGFAILLACLVVPFGAYVRLSDAGLGCPDWPGCYGQLSPHHAADTIQQIAVANPDGPVSLPKAWKEMLHRYLAASLGLVILLTAVLAWRRRHERLPASLLLAGVVVQGLLGMWTVTLLLKPAIVSLHLIGGMSIAAGLLWFGLRRPAVEAPHAVTGLAWLLVLAVLLQIALGGWVSSNYAALACQGFPTCNGAWLPPAMRFEHAFHLWRELGMAPDGTPLDSANLIAIHWLHRAGAVLVSLLVWSLVLSGWRQAALRPSLLLLLGAWLLQVALGIANVLLQLPLPLAVAHNAGALLLLSVTVLLAAQCRWRALPALPTLSVRLHHGLTDKRSLQ
ncbi:COX15/CtaA family protein [Pseudogulbenkiania ferrooxidans]|uniref:Cytochrome oxidase assembly n=1 Tax=Pseudogulbenkiania ferrooxidans 2002 TaxID=279714 RepID=B9YYA6_9NEIS|nr:COX15/CtaA family protein [Pseudogulbenkiania ferrooxidans]EEG10109.1 cytochrome oxidase assembly [Pseudogulbenkiania ferrooxidans 2002]